MDKRVKAQLTRTDSEAVACAIVTAVSSLSVNDASKFDTAELVLAKAFRADLWHSRPADEWVRIANALDNDYLKRVGEKRTKQAFNRLSRAGLIRSRKHGRKMYKELNLEWGL